MSLPSEIWTLIIKNTTDKKSCKNLYKSLPKSTQLMIKDDYEKHHAIFKKSLCIAYNKNIVIYYKNKIIRKLEHSEYVHKVEFRPNYSQIIFSDNSSDIYLWDYLTNEVTNLVRSPQGRLSPLLSQMVNIYFHISPCGKFMIVHYYPLQEQSLYKFDIEQRKREYIPYFFESINTNFSIVFNPIADEFTLESSYFQLGNRFQIKINIINSKTLVSNFFTNNDFYRPYYDENGTLYLAKKNNGIYKLNSDRTLEQVLSVENYINNYIVKNGLIYYFEKPNQQIHILKIFNMHVSDFIPSFEITPIIPYELISNLKISRDSRKLIFSSDCRIIFFNLETNKIDKIINGSSIDDKESITNRVISDYCIKNFYNYF